MSERIRSIRFEHFRGLPAYLVEPKGKSVVILGGNGKGKSAIVDGLEFLFEGRITRFHGEGTGAIDAAETVRHVLNKGEPVVEVCFTPTNGCVKRCLSDTTIQIPDRPEIKSYVTSHPPVGAFILRRAQILDFIRDQDATRYQKYIHLLGLSDIDSMQKAFVDALDRAEANRQLKQRVLQLQLAAFRDPSTGWFPTTAKSILDRCSTAVAKLGGGKVADWKDVPPVIALLETKRSSANKTRVDAFNRAIMSLQRPLPGGMEMLVEEARTLHSTLQSLQSASDEAAKSAVIREGIAFLSAHAESAVCPLCGQDLADGYAQTLEQLKERNSALGLLQDAEARYANVIDQLATDTQRIADQLEDDLAHTTLIGSGERRALRGARASTLRFVRLLRGMRRARGPTDLQLPSHLTTISAVRSAVVNELQEQRQALIPSDETQLENTIALLTKCRDGGPLVRKSEEAVMNAVTMANRMAQAKTAFSRAREEAIQKAFDRIAGLVLEYYRKLHDYGTLIETSECSDLAFSQTSRAAAGGLRLVIRFLGGTGLRDPRPFLSEGHLDSLGLCLYLATVRIFNRPGSLLVLDDVLTSIDQGHRYRVAELLFEGFRDYQIILTTHDQHWFEILQSSVRARGEQRKWRFIKIVRWTLERGPESGEFEGTWDYINENLKEEAYRELGGPLRVVFEDFLKRVAAKLELKVRYNLDSRYTSGDFSVAGIDNELRNKLIEASPADEVAIKQDIGRVFGNGDLINFLSHDSPGRLDVTFEQTSDFVTGLKSLATRCEANKLIKGVTV